MVLLLPVDSSRKCIVPTRSASAKSLPLINLQPKLPEAKVPAQTLVEVVQANPLLDTAHDVGLPVSRHAGLSDSRHLRVVPCLPPRMLAHAARTLLIMSSILDCGRQEEQQQETVPLVLLCSHGAEALERMARSSCK